MADFAIHPKVAVLRDQVRGFIRDEVIPRESEPQEVNGPNKDLRRELQVRAKTSNIFGPQLPEELGGLGLSMSDLAVVLEEAGYSLLGPQALNCAAPDEGNMHLLHRIATPEQRDRFLQPLAAGDIRSCFAMTEPAPGAGSDPSMLATRATRLRTDAWSLNGRKWFVTGGDGAGFAICMALADEGPTMFLVETSNPGWQLHRNIAAMDHAFPGGHAEVSLNDCIVTEGDILGELGRGFEYADIRLAPARLTHCMRWVGIAQRSLDIAIDRIVERQAFGARLADLGMVQERIAMSVLDIEASRQLIQRSAWTLDQGQPARHETSIAKAFVAEAVHRVVDRSVQVCGALGVSDDLPLARFLAEVRPFRIYDGPTETHYWSIARRAIRLREAERQAA